MKAFKWMVQDKWLLEAFDPGKYLIRKYELHEGWLHQATSVGFEARTGAEAERLALQHMAVADGRVVDGEADKAAASAKTVSVGKWMPAGLVSSTMDGLIQEDVDTVTRLGLRGVLYTLGSPNRNGESLLVLTGVLEEGTSYEEFKDLVMDEFGIDISVKQN